MSVYNKYSAEFSFFEILKNVIIVICEESSDLNLT